MNRTPDVGRHQQAAVTPRRRGTHEEVPSGSASGPAAEAVTPVLLKLPDLYPSPATDAAVRRLERTSSRISSASSSTAGRPRQEEATVPAGAPPIPLKTKETTNWNNRIIVSTFVVTLVASIYMVIERAARDPEEARHSNAPFSATNELEPIPSHRIDRGSFQADARTTDLGASKRHEARREPSTASRIGTIAESMGFGTAAVSYEAESRSPHSAVQPIIAEQTYDLSGRRAKVSNDTMYQPRSLRLRSDTE